MLENNLKTDVGAVSRRGVHPKNCFFQRSFEPKPLIPRGSTMLIDAKNAPNHNQTLHTTCTLPGRSPNFFASCKRRATRPIANPQLSQRPRHTNRRTSACAAGKVDIDSRQDGHLDPKTARSIPATHEQQHTICAWHAKRDACPHQAKPHIFMQHRHDTHKATAHGRPHAPSWIRVAL